MKYIFKSGKDNPCWKGGRHKNSRGYITLRIDKKNIFEHRYIMEKFLKRKLLNNEIVHHINHIKDDNRIENLMLCKTQLEHCKNHYGKTGKKKRLTDEELAKIRENSPYKNLILGYH